MRLTIAGRANEDDAALPGDVISFINGACREELFEVFTNVELKAALQDKIIECRAFDILKEKRIFLPATSTKHEHLTTHLGIPLAHSQHEVPGTLFAIS